MLWSDLADQISNRMRILLVDDEEILRQLSGRLFSARNWTVSEAGSAEEALIAWQPGRFDAVVTDFLMPGMNGISLAKRIRASEARHPSTMPARLILLSGSVLESDFGADPAQGLFDAVLAKPTSFDAVLNAVNGECARRSG